MLRNFSFFEVDQEWATPIINALNNQRFNGEKIMVEPAANRPDERPAASRGEGRSDFKRSSGKKDFSKDFNSGFKGDKKPRSFKRK